MCGAKKMCMMISSRMRTMKKKKAKMSCEHTWRLCSHTISSRGSAMGRLCGWGWGSQTIRKARATRREEGLASVSTARTSNIARSVEGLASASTARISTVAKTVEGS